MDCNFITKKSQPDPIKIQKGDAPFIFPYSSSIQLFAFTTSQITQSIFLEASILIEANLESFAELVWRMWS